MREGSGSLAVVGRLAVFGIVEVGQVYHENRAQKSQAEAVWDAFAKAFSKLYADDGEDEDVDEGDEEQKQPPSWLAGNLKKQVGVVEGDESLPRFDSGFRENSVKSDAACDEYDEGEHLLVFWCGWVVVRFR